MTKLEARELIESVPLFSELETYDIDELAGNCKAVRLAPGETLVRSGDPSVSVFIVVEGELEVLRQTGNSLIPLGVRGRGEVVGEMALLTNGPRSATLRARGEARVLEIEQKSFANWLERHPGAAMKVLGTIVRRLQSAEGHLVQYQHLTALGTLAAGLAHELNNPASALLRSAGRLSASVSDWSRLSWNLGELSDGAASHDVLMSHLSSMRDQSSEPLNPIEASDREGEVASWLRERGVPEPWKLAPVLVENGWDAAALQEIAATVDIGSLVPTVQWFASGGTVIRLLDELRMSAQVISDLVAAVKSYSRLDEAPVQTVDIHAGIDQSVTILRHKMRGLEVVREYSPSLPAVTANPGELNQLWTNLIDNAADAAGPNGRIIIRTRADATTVLVEIEDNGHGVPDEIGSRLFEPFFTTRAPGDGTGLGLAISLSIVQKHRGTIDFESRPGRTVFRVQLPRTR